MRCLLNRGQSSMVTRKALELKSLSFRFSSSPVLRMHASVCSRRRFPVGADCNGIVHPSSPRRVSRRRRSKALRCRMMFGSPEDQPELTPVPDSIPSTGMDSDWRSFRAKLVGHYLPPEEREIVEWAHPLSTPELGCILVAHPLMFSEKQTYFNLAVVFIFVHDHTGSAGLILNKPTRYAFGELDIAKSISTGFEENPLYLGGDVGDESLNFLHRFKDLENSIEVVDGVYLNGFEAAQKEVLRGAKNPADFKWYARYCGWNPGQLEEECKSGVWFPAACSSELIVKEQSMVHGPADLWHQVMQLMGGEYKELSDVVIESSIKNESVKTPPEETKS